MASNRWASTRLENLSSWRCAAPSYLGDCAWMTGATLLQSGYGRVRLALRRCREVIVQARRPVSMCLFPLVRLLG
jgi:hypothetical protein